MLGFQNFLSFKRKKETVLVSPVYIHMVSPHGYSQ